LTIGLIDRANSSTGVSDGGRGFRGSTEATRSDEAGIDEYLAGPRLIQVRPSMSTYVAELGPGSGSRAEPPGAPELSNSPSTLVSPHEDAKSPIIRVTIPAVVLISHLYLSARVAPFLTVPNEADANSCFAKPSMLIEFQEFLVPAQA
jgi:hypothetical protein